MAASTAIPTTMLVFAAAFSFYFGGMAASYTAPVRRRLHGVLVVPVAFVISPIINLATGQAMFPGVDDPVTVLLAALFLCVSLAAAYIGARRGDALFTYNQRMKRRAPR
jgi:hypothetical protein